jgi:hypothetical protein
MVQHCGVDQSIAGHKAAACGFLHQQHSTPRVLGPARSKPLIVFNRYHCPVILCRTNVLPMLFQLFVFFYLFGHRHATPEQIKVFIPYHVFENIQYRLYSS